MCLCVIVLVMGIKLTVTLTSFCLFNQRLKRLQCVCNTGVVKNSVQLKLEPEGLGSISFHGNGTVYQLVYSEPF